MLLYKTLIQVLFAPTRYLFVKDPLAFRQEETSLSTHFPTVKRFLQAFFNSSCEVAFAMPRDFRLQRHLFAAQKEASMWAAHSCQQKYVITFIKFNSK